MITEPVERKKISYNNLTKTTKDLVEKESEVGDMDSVGLVLNETWCPSNVIYVTKY